MIGAKLFSADPKASMFPDTRAEESGQSWHFDLGRHAMSLGWSATRN
jgi:hypothetical protein